MAEHDFVHLHLHSEYSLLDGACRIRDIPKAAKAAGQSAVAITDHGVMYGCAEFYKACKAEGVKPVIGCEVYVSRTSMYGRERDYDHLVLLVKNDTGWKNLIFLVSKGFTDGFYIKPRIDLELLAGHSEGLICLSACLSGFIQRSIAAGDYVRAESYALRLDSIFGRGNFYLELQDHGLPDDDTVCAGLSKISGKTGIPLVATNDVHYLEKKDAEIQSVLMCIQTNSTMDDGKPVGFETDEFWFKSADDMYRIFGKYKDACENTRKIADMCSFDLEFGKTKLPRYVPENGMKPEEYLKALSDEGFERRIEEGRIVFDETNTREVYEKRAEYELSVIASMGYTEYYLIVWDFVHYAKSEGIPVGPGRGSGAGSLVAFFIGITDIDSIKFGLLFERFLNPERVSMPDFDIDFCYNRRDEAIQYVRRKYGEDHTAQIVTFGTLAARAAIRDVGRALGMSYNEVDDVARLIPRELNITIADAVKGSAELTKIIDSDFRVKRLITIATAVEGMPRHASTHAAGVVITENPVTDYVPVSMNGGIVVTQFDMETIADLGLLKIDFLALRYLTIIDNAERQIKENDPSFSLADADINDPATYDTICQGKCDGVFQLESGGMRQMLTQLRPRRLEDIIAAIALYRPGPMDSIPKYIEASHDPAKISYCTPKLAPILDITYGCIVYQEQVMQIFRELAGYSFGHADVVRRAIAKKKAGVLESERSSFIEGAVSRGITESDALSLFEDIVSFANYAFNKSHAAAYGVLSFRTAYLKTHYPREYVSALLTSVQSSTEKLIEYMADLSKQGIKILPPDINRSRSGFRVENGSVRFGLCALKSIGEGMVDKIVSERERAGLYKDPDDFVERTIGLGLNRKHLEVLIKSGTLDSLGVKRRCMMASIDTLLENHSKRSGDDGQISLFDSGEVKEPGKKKTEYPVLEEYTLKDRLEQEKESIGIYLSGHALDDYRLQLDKLGPDNIISLIQAGKQSEDDEETESVYTDRSKVKIAGIVTKRTNKQTKKGASMSFITVEDRTASIEVLVFPELALKYGPIINTDSVLFIFGTLSLKDEEDAKVLATEILALRPDSAAPVRVDDEQAAKKPAIMTPNPGVNNLNNGQIKKVYLRVPTENCESYRRAAAFCRIFTGDIPAVFYSVETGKYSGVPLGIQPSQFVMNELREILGDANVAVK